jgi:hypothetical protein
MIVKPVLKTLFVVTVALVGPLALAASFEDLPKRKPGLWETTITPGDGQHPPPTNRMCLDAETDRELVRFGMGATNQVCSKHDISISGNVATIDAVCQLGPSKQTTRSTITYTGNTAYRTQVKAQFDPPFLGKTESSTSTEAKWTGPCPADMKPGDMVMGNGVKINIKDVAAAKKGPTK